MLICEKCELSYLNKILQERFLEKKQHKEKILMSLEEKFAQTQENLNKKRQIMDMLEVQVLGIFLKYGDGHGVYKFRKRMKKKCFWRK